MNMHFYDFSSTVPLTKEENAPDRQHQGMIDNSTGSYIFTDCYPV